MLVQPALLAIVLYFVSIYSLISHLLEYTLYMSKIIVTTEHDRPAISDAGNLDGWVNKNSFPWVLNEA